MTDFGTEPTTDSYQVDPAKCTFNYPQPLVLQTNVPAERDELSNIVACSSTPPTATYLKNDSDAVWTLHRTGLVPGTITHYDATAESTSFRAVVNNDGLLVPGDSVVVDLPPTQLEWDIDLQLSVAWQGHEVAVERIQSLGETALVAALKHKSAAGAALVKCTLAVDSYAGEVGDLREKDDVELTDIVTTGLGAGIAGSTCRSAAKEIRIPDATDPQRAVALSEDLAHLDQNAELLEGLKTRVSTFEKFATGLDYGFKLLTHH